MSLKLPTGEDGEAFLARIVRPDETLRWSSVMRWRRVTVGPGPAFPILAAEGPRKMQIGVTSRGLVLLDPDSKERATWSATCSTSEVRLYRADVDGRRDTGVLLVTRMRPLCAFLSGPTFSRDAKAFSSKQGAGTPGRSRLWSALRASFQSTR